MKKLALKFVVDVNFLCNKASVIAAMLRDMVGGTQYCNSNSNNDLQLFLYNMFPNLFLSVNRLHHISGKVRLSSSLKFSGTLSIGV